MKKLLLILALIGVIVLTAYGALSGTYTSHNLIYRPGYGSYGLEEFNEFNTYQEILDNQVWANKTASGDENIQDVAGAMFTGNTETFITNTYQDTDGTVDSVVPVKDEDNMASDSATYLATQQSIKAYVDSVAGTLTHLGLTDTPAAYTDQAGKYVRVNAGEDALEFGIPAGAGTVTTSGTPADNDYAKFTDATTIEGRSYSELKTDLAYQLSDLSDVNTSTPTDKFVLIADGVEFESRALVEADVSDLGTATAMIADKLSVFAATTSAELAGVISDEIGSGALLFRTALSKMFPNNYSRDIRWALKEPYTTAANRYIIETPNRVSVDINGTNYFIETLTDIDLSVEATWDSITTDYRVAATRAGKDFYVYACVPGSGDAPTIKLSANSTVPTGYTADNSRKIGGFHCLCVAVGTIASHTLTGFVAGDVLPASIWDLRHRAVCENEGMVYDEKSQIWVDIYLASGTGASTASVNTGTISATRNWMDFVDDGGAIGKRMLTDIEFQLIATGSNEETNITGSADPGYTTGHTDTAGRRMISNIGCEDCCGVLYQWLNEQSYRLDGADFAAAKSWAWYNLPGVKGSLYKQADYGDVKLRAGGAWGSGASCGSRCRNANTYRWYAHSGIGCRFGAEPRKSE